MKNAKELMLEYTAYSFPKKAAEMFAEDGAFELPYLATFGLPTQYRGRDAIAGFFQSVLDIYPAAWMFRFIKAARTGHRSRKDVVEWLNRFYRFILIGH
jgi:hypothetical protein